jgi:hypothetical protein
MYAVFWFNKHNEFNIKKKGQMSFNYGERGKKKDSPVLGGGEGGGKMATQAIPPPPMKPIHPQNRRIWSK